MAISDFGQCRPTNAANSSEQFVIIFGNDLALLNGQFQARQLAEVSNGYAYGYTQMEAFLPKGYCAEDLSILYLIST